MFAAQGTLLCPSGTGTFSVTGLPLGGRAPAVVFFWGTKQTAEGIAIDNTNFFGCATSAAQRWVVAQFSKDNVSATDFNRTSSAILCIRIMATASTNSVAANFVSMDVNGFTVTFSTVTVNTIIHYMALGGMTNVKAGLITFATSTGNQDFTDPGFTPDCTLLCGPRTIAANWGNFLQNVGFTLGAGTSASARWGTAISGNSLESTTALVDAMSTQRTDNIYMAIFETGLIDAIADYSGGIANGFRLNVSDAPGAAHQVGYVCFQGGSYAVGAFSAPTSGGGTNDVNVGFTPAAVLFSTWNKASSTSILSNNDINTGGAVYSGIEGCVGAMTVDAVLNTQADSYTVTTKAIRTLLGGTPMTVDGEADSDLTGVGGANTFRLTWPNAPAVAAEVCYVAFGPQEFAVARPTPISIIGQAVHRAFSY